MPSRSSAPIRAAFSTRPSRSMIAQRRQARGHRQAVAAERRLVHVGALERADGALVDLAPRDHRGDGHVAAAERLADEHEVRLEAPVLEREPAGRCARARSAPRRARTACRSGGTAPARPADSRRAAGVTMRPWIGSTMKAATSPCRSSRLRARSRSPKGTRAQPGSSGPKPSLKNSSPTSESGPSVTPWKLAVARDQARPARRRARELHRRVHGLGAACSRRTRRPGRRGRRWRQRLGEHAGQRRVVELHAVDEIGGERRLQHLAHIGMVVAEAGEALAGMEVEIGAPVGVVEVGAPRRRVRLVEAEDPQHVDERGVEVARGQSQRVLRARGRIRDHAEGVERSGGLRVGVHRGRRQSRYGRASPVFPAWPMAV